MYGLLSKGYEALLPAGTAYEVQLAQSATVKITPEAITPVSSAQTVLTPSQLTGPDKSGSLSTPNLSGIWYWSSWGHLKLLQAAGERKLYGRAEGYDVDGIINDAVLSCITLAGEVYYTIELDLVGDANTLAGKYSSGEMKAGSKTKSMVISRVLYAGSSSRDRYFRLECERRLALTRLGKDTTYTNSRTAGNHRQDSRVRSGWFCQRKTCHSVFPFRWRNVPIPRAGLYGGTHPDGRRNTLRAIFIRRDAGSFQDQADRDDAGKVIQLSQMWEELPLELS